MPGLALYLLESLYVHTHTEMGCRISVLVFVCLRDGAADGKVGTLGLLPGGAMSPLLSSMSSANVLIQSLCCGVEPCLSETTDLLGVY